MLYLGTVLGGKHCQKGRKERTNGTGLHGRQEGAVHHERNHR